MEITEVRVYPVTHDDDRLLAFATVTFDNAFVVRDLRLIRGNKGLFVAMPSRRRSDGTYSDVAHPLIPELRDQIEQKIIGEFQTIPGKRGKAEASKPPEDRAEASASPGEPQRMAV